MTRNRQAFEELSGARANQGETLGLLMSAFSFRPAHIYAVGDAFAQTNSHPFYGWTSSGTSLKSWSIKQDKLTKPCVYAGVDP